MFWFWIPIVVVTLFIIGAVWAAAARRKQIAGQKQSGQTLFDQNRNKAPDAPPA